MPFATSRRRRLEARSLASTVCACVVPLFNFACSDSGSGKTSASQAMGQRALAAESTLTVTPSTNLVDHQYVLVEGDGFAPDGGVTVSQCVLPVDEPTDDCGGAYLNVQADSEGHIWTWLLMLREFRAAFTGRALSCDAGPCVLRVMNESVMHEVPTTFLAPGAPPPPPPPPAPTTATITLTPSSELAELQEITVRGTGFTKGPFVGAAVPVELAVCKAGADLGPMNYWGRLSPTDCSEGRQENAFGPLDGFYTRLTVQTKVTPPGGPPFDCSQHAGDCFVVAKPLTDQRAPALAPLAFRSMDPPKRGSLTAGTPAIVDPFPVTLTGNGWAKGSTVLVRFCATGLSAEYGCSFEKPVFVNSDGSFSTSVNTQRVVQNADFDCASAPGACVIEAVDSRDREHTKAIAPLTLAPLPVTRGTATITTTPIIANVTAQIMGTGWRASKPLDLVQCAGAGFSKCNYMTSVTPDANGAFRAYATLAPTIPASEPFDCTQPSSCSLVVYDFEAPTQTAVRIPLVFQDTDSIDIVSRYEPAFESLFQQGVTLSGWTPGELQLRGQAIAAYLLAYTSTKTGAHFSSLGSASHTTHYTASEFVYWSAVAARFDYRVDELQKAGALFWSWYLAGMPPFPTL